MKSIATEIVKRSKLPYLIRTYMFEAKQHALTCQTILDAKDYLPCNNYNCDYKDLLEWCESEIKILKEGGLIC
jgi:hypothetical protein